MIRTAFLMLYIICIQIVAPLPAVAEEAVDPAPLEQQSSMLSLCINELMWMGSDRSTADEWVELTAYGTGSGAAIDRVSLDGWTLSLIKGGMEEIIADLTGLSIGSGNYLVVSNDGSDESRLKTIPALVTTTMSLPNTQLMVRLKKPDGTVVDEVDDGIGVPFAGNNASGTPKASMERVGPCIRENVKEHWQTAVTARGFDAGASLLGTPGYPNGTVEPRDLDPPPEAEHLFALRMSDSLLIGWQPSVSLDLAWQKLSLEGENGVVEDRMLPASATGQVLQDAAHITYVTLTSIDESGNETAGIRKSVQPYTKPLLSELIPDPPGSDDGEWIELHNRHDFPFTLAGWDLKSGQTRYRFPGGDQTTTVESGAMLLLPKDSTGLQLPNAGGGVSLSFMGQVVETFAYGQTPEGISRGRDDVDGQVPYCVPTPGFPNAPGASTIYIEGLVPGLLQPSTINLSVRAQSGSIAEATCRWDFGDGYMYDGCNPPAHAMKAAGLVTLRLEVVDYCGTTMKQTVQMEITGGNSSRKKETTKASEATSCTQSSHSGVVMTELLPRPQAGNDEWVELRNNADADISLCGWSIDDGEGGSKPYALDRYRLGRGESLLLLKKETGLALNDDADVVRLIAPLMGGGTGVLMKVPYHEAREGESWALRDDGEWLWSPFMTPGSDNRFRSVDLKTLGSPVILSAVLPDPKGGDEGNEWVELTNVTNRPQWLNGWYLATENGDSRESLQGTVLRRFETIRLSIKSFSLRNSQGELKLIDAQENTRSLLAWNKPPTGEVIQRRIGKKEGVERWVITENGKLNFRLAGEGKKRWKTDLQLAGIVVPDDETIEGKTTIKNNYINLIKALKEKKNIELENDTSNSFYAWVDGADVQEVLLRTGIAYLDTAASFPRQEEYAAYEREAQSEKRGIWSKAEWARLIEEEKQRRYWAGIVQREGLVLNVTPGSGLVEQGALVTVGTNVPADILKYARSGAWIPFLGGAIVKDGPLLLKAVFRDGEHATAKTEVARSFVVRRSQYPSCLCIAEIFPSPEKGEGEWLELYNKCEQDISLTGWIMTDRTAEKTIPFEADAVLPGKQYRLLSGALLPVSLNNGGDAIVLKSPNNRPAVFLTYPSIKKGQAYALVGEEYCLTEKPTPGASNECVHAAKHTVHRGGGKKKQTVGLKTSYVYAQSKQGMGGSGADLLEQLKGQLLGKEDGLDQEDSGAVAWHILLSFMSSFVALGIWWEWQRKRM